MRGDVRRRRAEDEEESAFVSMTDMTVSFLFIVMVLLAFFASQLDDDVEKVPKAWLDDAVAARDAAVAEAAGLRDELAAKEARVAELENEVAWLRRDLESARREIARLQDEIERLAMEIAALKERLRRLEVRDPLEAYITSSAAERRRILETLRDDLKLRFPDLTVVVSEESDALRFQGDGLFDKSRSALRTDKRAIVDAVASRLERVLPCYTLGERTHWSEVCNPGLAIIEAVQIEGHTDSDGSAVSNLRLSTERANATFVAMTEREPGLVDHLNIRDQPVISVAGYGEMRPVAENDSPAAMATNRRIDLRLIMYVPRQASEVGRIRDLLNGTTAEAVLQ